MKKKLLSTALLFLTVFIVSAGAEDDPVLAIIGDTKITMKDFNRMTSFYDAEKQQLLKDNPNYKVIILRRFVQGKVIAKLAKKEGFDQQGDMKDRLELIVNDFLATEYVKEKVIAKIQVTEEDIKLYYQTHEEDFTSPEMIRARHILIKAAMSASDEEKKSAREKAEGILERIKDGEDFATIAEEVSDDAGTQAKGGDLGFFPRGRMIPEFEKAAFALNPGEMSDIVETPYGYHIITVEEKKEASPEPFEKVKDTVREKAFKELREARVTEFVEKALNDEGVTFNFDPFMPKKE
jgi:parvulin-like peptidyl-prolyl isomerase